MAELTFVDRESQKDKFCGIYFFGWEKTRIIKFFLHSLSLFQHKIHKYVTFSAFAIIFILKQNNKTKL